MAINEPMNTPKTTIASIFSNDIMTRNVASPLNRVIRSFSSVGICFSNSIMLFSNCLINDGKNRNYDHQRFLLHPTLRTRYFTLGEPLFNCLAFFSAFFLVLNRKLVTVIGLFPFLLAINHFF